MDILNLREPFSAWSHGAWFLLSLPGAVLLWRGAVGDRPRQWSLLGYAICLALCASASTTYHGVRVVSHAELTPYLLCDHIGVYLLIAGTYTPLALTLMRGRWRRITLTAVWLAAALGATLHVTFDDLPNWLTTGLYLAMGWGAVFCYVELSRTTSHRDMSPILIGGALYSVGAAFHVLNWPVLWPGVVGPHEVFHVFVIAGSVVHYRFMLRVIAPWDWDRRPPAWAANYARTPGPPATAMIPIEQVLARAPGYDDLR